MLKMEYFYYINEINNYGSINKASEALFVSQPYLSVELKKLESLLGVKLFQRTNKGVKLTQAGEEFLSISKKIINLEAKACNLKEKYNFQEQSLSIFSMPSFTMMDIISEYKKMLNLNEQLFYTEMPNKQVVEEIKKGRCNLGLYYICSENYDSEIKNLQDSGLIFTPLVNEPICAIVNKNNKLFNNTEIKLNDLSEFKFLVESIKLHNEKYPVENNLLPKFFKSSTKNPQFNNNRSMLYFLTKNDEYFSIGQRALNITNPFVESQQLKYIPIRDINISFITGYLINENNSSSDMEENFITYIENYFILYNQKNSLYVI